MDQLLEKIRKSKPAKKKRLLIILSSISMVIIISFWLMYMNAFVINNAEEKTTAEVSTNFWPVIMSEAGAAVKNIGSGIGGFFSNAADRLPKLGGENKVTIQNP